MEYLQETVLCMQPREKKKKDQKKTKQTEM